MSSLLQKKVTYCNILFMCFCFKLDQSVDLQVVASCLQRLNHPTSKPKSGLQAVDCWVGLRGAACSTCLFCYLHFVTILECVMFPSRLICMVLMPLCCFPWSRWPYSLITFWRAGSACHVTRTRIFATKSSIVNQFERHGSAFHTMKGNQ